MSAVTLGRFSYGEISSDLADQARGLVDRARRLNHSYIEGCISLGEELASFKQRIEHGVFVRWVEAEFPFGPRMAQHYMAAALAFSGPNAKRVSHLPFRVVAALSASSVSVEAREEIVQKVESDRSIPPVEVMSSIKEVKAADKSVRRIQRMKPAQRSNLKRRENQKRREEEEWQAKRQRERDAAGQAADLVANALGEQFGEFVALVQEMSLFDFKDAVLRGPA